MYFEFNKSVLRNGFVVDDCNSDDGGAAIVDLLVASDDDVEDVVGFVVIVRFRCVVGDERRRVRAWDARCPRIAGL